jgi:hypothetical protein
MDPSCQADGRGMTHADFAIAIFNDTTGEVSFFSFFPLINHQRTSRFLELIQMYFALVS